MVLDRDPQCAAAALSSPRVRVEAVSWDEGLARHLAQATPGDHVVPYHWAPHVLLDWLAHDLGRHGLRLDRAPLAASVAPRTGAVGGLDPRPRVADDTATAEALPACPPVTLTTGAGDVAMSYADFVCPVSCIEPALCPHTRGPRSWTLAGELGRVRHSYVFPCTHLAWGVGTIPVSSIFSVREQIVASRRQGDLPTGAALWISTASHCHGLAARVVVGADR